MSKKLIITERQLSLLANFIKENKDYEFFLNNIVDNLNKNYELIVGTYRKGGEFFEKPMIRIKANNEIITPKDLLQYLNL